MKVFTTLVFGTLLASSVSAFPMTRIVRRRETIEAGRVVLLNNNAFSGSGRTNNRVGNGNGNAGSTATNKAGNGNGNAGSNTTNKTGSGNTTVSGGDKAGALYLITNEQDTNFVISADIGSDGKLALRQAISAGGTGVHGADRNKNALGPLFSAGSVQVSPAAKMLATVNSGSNTIALFSINEQDPAALTKVGSTVESGGDFPISVAFNSKGDTLCALNGGEANGIRCFKADKVNGLVPLAGTNRVLGINQTTPANGAPGTASHIIFSEDDKQLIASVKGIPDPKAADGRGTNGALAIWDVVNDGSLSAQFNIVAAPGKGLAPFGMAIVPNQKAVFAADPFIGFDVLDLNVQGGTNRSVDVTVDNQQTMGWVSRSPTTGNFFVSDGFTSHISEIKLGNDLRGVVVSDTDMADSGTHDNTIATVNGKDFLYVLSSKAMAIDVLAIDKNAKPAKLQRQDLATAVKAAQLSISPDNLSGLAAFVKA